MSEINEVARDIAQDIRVTEQAFAPAIAAVGTFFARLPAYEATALVAPARTQKLYDTFAKACVAIADARRQVVMGHHQFYVLGKAIGAIPATSVGPDDCPPPNAPPDAMPSPEMSLGEVERQIG